MKSYIKYKTTNFQSLIIKGQGVFMFDCSYNNNCKIDFTDETKKNTLSFYFTPLNIYVMQDDTILLEDPDNDVGLIHKSGAYYWISIDSQNQRLSCGIGEARVENKVYYYEYTKNTNKKYLETLTKIQFPKEVQPFIILRDPITRTIPLLVCKTDELTIDDIAQSTYLPHSNLSTVGQKLFDCVSGKKFVLDDESFPDFSKAIEHSINTPGLWCYQKLLEKASEFDKDHPNVLETYLRITLGENNGQSPGIPYVIEIWPSNHYSPIHAHSQSNAIIRVLHGSIHVRLYPFLNNDIEPFHEVDIDKDQNTWISPFLNQYHQLENVQQETCITIQCYMYETDDSSHYDYFDYLDGSGKVHQYEPDSDMDFVQFKQLMKIEYSKTKHVSSTINHVNHVCYSV